MSLYTPSTIAAADLDIALPPYFGGEFAMYISHTPAKVIASILMSAAAVGALTDNAATTITTGGAHLQVVPTTFLRSTVSPVITLACLDDTGTPVAMNGVATWAPPARVTDQSYNFQRGYAVDLAPATVGKKFTAITSLTTIAGGAANVGFDIYELPDLSSYYLVGCTTDKNFTTKGRTAKGIDCGMETDAFIKRGKSKPGNLTCSSKFKGFADGLARADGDKVTAMLVGIKDGQVTGDRLIFTEWVMSSAVKLPDGEGEAMLDAEEGKYRELLMFVAP